MGQRARAGEQVSLEEIKASKTKPALAKEVALKKNGEFVRRRWLTVPGPDDGEAAARLQALVDLSNDSRFRTGVVPAGNIIATPEEVSRFFETLLCGGAYEDTRVFEQRTVARAVAPQVTGQVDRVLMMPIPLSMGFMLGLNSFGFFGPRTANAYGHLGFTNVLGWADPDRDISVALMNTGKPLLSARMLSWLNVSRVIGTRIPRDRA